jgi:hypothetical protein
MITLQKPGKDPKFPKNIRPTNPLSTMSKLFEKVRQKKSPMAHKKGLLNANQFGFRAHHSTSRCMRLTDHVTHNFNSNMSMAAVILEFEKEFDTT